MTSEREAVTNAVQDLQNVLNDLPAVLDKIDWNKDHASIASRAAVLGPFMNDLVFQFAETFATIGNAGLDGGSQGAADYLAGVMGDAFADLFVGPWGAMAERVAEAKHEGPHFHDLEDRAVWARSSAEAA